MYILYVSKVEIIMILIRASSKGNLVVPSCGWRWPTSCGCKCAITPPNLPRLSSHPSCSLSFKPDVMPDLGGQHWAALGSIGNGQHGTGAPVAPNIAHRLFSHFLRPLFSRFLIEYSPPSFSSASFRHIFYSSLKNQILQILIFFVHIIYVEYSFYFQPPPLHNILITSQYPQYPSLHNILLINVQELWIVDPSHIVGSRPVGLHSSDAAGPPLRSPRVKSHYLWESSWFQIIYWYYLLRNLTILKISACPGQVVC